MKKTTKCIFGTLAILAAFAFISCQSDDGGNSDSDSPKVEQSGTTDEGGTGSDSSGTGTTDAEQPGTSDEGGTGSDSSNTDTPDVELPGTPRALQIQRIFLQEKHFMMRMKRNLENLTYLMMEL